MTEFDPLAAVETALSQKSQEERNKEVAWQQEQRSKMRIPSALEINYILGCRMADAAQKALEADDDHAAFDKLAQGLALQGKWGEAIAAARDLQLKRQFQEVFAAVTSNHNCQCPDGDKFIKQEVLHEQRPVKLIFCTKCELLQC